MLAGSGLAAMSSLILFAPPQPYLVQVVYKITTALAITAAAFGWRSKRLAGYGGLLVCSAEYRPWRGRCCWPFCAPARSGYSQPDGVSARFAAAFISAVGRLLRRSGS